MRRAAWAVLVILLAAKMGDASAQLLDQVINPDIPGLRSEPGVTVTSRLRPDYDYRGIRAGSFLIRPEVSEEFGYDDNVTGTTQKQGSPVWHTRANLEAASSLSRRSVVAALLVEDYRYLDQPKQSYTNWTAAIGGTYKIGRDTASLSYAHSNLNQTPRDLDTPLLDQSLPYRIDVVRGSYRIGFNRLSLEPSVAVSRYDFDNGTVAGAPYVQDFRNRTVFAPGIVASYELAPQRRLVAVARNLTAKYDEAPAGSVVRNFNDTSLLAGIDYGGDLWRYRVLLGYEVRNFSSSAIKTIQAPIVEGTVIFTPTGLTTLTGRVARRIQDSADETTVGYIATEARLTVDHEYRRNVLLRMEAGVTLNDYNQGGGNQVLYNASASAKWLLNPNMRLGAVYGFATRRSSAAASRQPGQGFALGGSFSESRYMLQLSLGL